MASLRLHPLLSLRPTVEGGRCMHCEARGRGELRRIAGRCFLAQAFLPVSLPSDPNAGKCPLPCLRPPPFPLKHLLHALLTTPHPHTRCPER
eukprot:364429-Chlamydomonas_euryale.AAC.20